MTIFVTFEYTLGHPTTSHTILDDSRWSMLSLSKVISYNYSILALNMQYATTGDNDTILWRAKQLGQTVRRNRGLSWKDQQPRI